MTNPFKLAGMFLLATLLFTSCKDCDTTVTQVTEDDTKWLVYDRGDTVRFVNENNETVRFTTSVLRADQVPGEGFNVTDNCIEQYDIQAVSIIEDTNKEYPRLATFFLKRPNTFDMALLVEEVGEYEINETQPTYPTATVNNNLYSEVFEVVRTDSSKTTNLKRILFNKEFGFLSVEYYNGKKLQLAQ
ncbi:hypothetical protein [Pontibacter roseus]|uniref:hypothetical protein n=1 Tax=Pontibacter roseus TaxID=336989 RepID=UPI0003652F46|nr:hypothetical protein [Pontibacter roseus]